MEYTHGIKKLLVDHSSVSALVGTKVYPVEAPSGTALPFVTYESTGTTVYHTKEKAQYEQARVEVVGYASTYAGAIELGRAMKAALARQTIKGTTPFKYNIDKVFLIDEEIERLEEPDRYAFVLEVEAFVVI